MVFGQIQIAADIGATITDTGLKVHAELDEKAQ